MWLWLSRLSIVITMLVGLLTVYERTGRRISIFVPWLPLILVTSIAIFFNIYYQRKREKEFINPFKDSDVVYKIKILNRVDGKIERWITFSNKSFLPIEKREHFIFGTTTVERLPLNAFDQNGLPLGVAMVDDQPAHKVFQVLFVPPIQPKSIYRYTYKYYWKKLFPSKQEWYEGHDYSKKIMYQLDLPTDTSLEDLHCEEYIGGGKSITCKEYKPRDTQQHKDRITHILHVKKKNSNHTTVLKWKIRNTN